ncbi:hypothetical protein PIIN_08169 [Serendipita indica DSM 11827]|uniref:Uncharacterized protein n=1 Tax=Serendipita indica (strain DSM 11827) TaxID=1109443 RepID=G4TSC3_SERID|nr:hypothetical protein PIIN_08169 [Serendipita indica DSM 11827]
MAGRRRPVRPPSPLDAPFVVRRHEAERGQPVYGNLMQELSYYHLGTSNEAVHKQEVIKWSPENKGDHGQLDRDVGDSSSLKELLTGTMARHTSPARSPSPLERALERRRRKSIQGRSVLNNPGRGPSHSDPDASEPANKAKIAKMSPEEQEKVLKTAEILFGVSDRQLDRHQRALGFVTCRHRVETTWKKGEPLPDSSENTGGSGYFSAS